MTKQEFLSASLPYQLKVKVLCGDGVFDTIDTLTIGNLYELGANRITPILRPLPDLTKEEFSFIYENETDFESIESIINMDCESFLSTKFSFLFWQQLIKNHFDIADLISKGEAIDVNDLEINPYK